MGLFGKIKDVINKAKETVNQNQEEANKRQEEARKQQEEANRFNPDGKSLEWFGSEDGIKTFNEYVTAQNYLLEETIKKEQETKYSEYSLEVVISVFYKDAKLPSIYFRKLVDKIDAQALEYVGPIDLLVKYLSIQAKPFYIDDDGEPQPKVPALTPEEIVSIDKNPALFFVKNFNCFEIADDAQGSFKDKYALWGYVLMWLCAYSSNKDVISENQWIFSKEAYFNELGTVRKLKGFLKKCMELTADEQIKSFFERAYNECE